MYYEKKVIQTNSQKEQYIKLLSSLDLTYEEVDYQLGIYSGETLIGGISLDKNCIKLMCVHKDYEGQGLSNTLLSDVIMYAHEKGINHLFVYTKPENFDIFNNNFYTIYKTDEVLFMESEKNGISNFVKSLKEKAQKGDKICSIVMNLNPITLGHEYLIKTASIENDYVHVFLVKEDMSVFPYDVRLNLLKQVTSKYNNVIIHEGNDYIISNATFPTYFIKSKDQVKDIYAKLDVNIFGKYIVDALNINCRYVGTEPYSKTTNMYNETLKKELPKYNVTVKEIERKEINGELISASKVRAFIKNGEIEKVKNIVPKETYDFLQSENAKHIIEKIIVSNSRH